MCMPIQKIEEWIDTSIPYALFVLLILLVLEFTIDTTPYEKIILFTDEIIFVLFVTDLCFKYHHVNNTLHFIKLYWIEILAVFPFYLLIRAYTALLELSKGVEETQKVLHETMLIKEARSLEIGREARFAEEAKILRESRLFRVTRVIQRGFRLLYGRLLLAHKVMHVKKVRKGNTS